ncbi:hypothetical protein BaRGS_00031528 [Batillaria attramentaria]|uniref:Calcineurin-like phosphoesterase domain-containing protein n=1 Tax=Batillaria attramentaria TaxID=370345 RepID=A0ABD0JQM8_9CAEN
MITFQVTADQSTRYHTNVGMLSCTCLSCARRAKQTDAMNSENNQFMGNKKSKIYISSPARAHGEFSNGIQIDIDTNSNSPDVAWQRLQESHRVRAVCSDLNLTPTPRKCLRVVCLSDTHGQVERKPEFLARVPDGDILLHAGDFTMGGDPGEIMNFDGFMSRLPHPVKIVIAGNHELTFESGAGYGGGVHPILARKKVPEFGTWGFSLKRGYPLLTEWNRIPSDTDILMTHGPPLGYGDSYRDGKHAGCVELLNTVVRRVKPQFHVFGHIHAGYGKWTNEKTVFINASICDNRYRPKKNPIVFDISLPHGYTRADFRKVTMETLREQLSPSMGCTECSGSEGVKQNGSAAAQGDELATELASVTL